jgi:hypothetical protein
LHLKHESADLWHHYSVLSLERCVSNDQSSC